MKINIRNSVFETNSSSSHAVNVDPSETYEFSIDKETLRSGVLRVNLRSFGSNFERFRTTENKVAYLVAQLCGPKVNSEPSGSDVRDIVAENARGAKLIEMVEHTLGCKIELIRPESKSFLSVYIGNDAYGIGMEVFENDEALKSFLFSKKSFVTTGNDNSQPPFKISNDLGVYEDYFEFMYEDTLRDEPKFVLVSDEQFNEVIFKTPSGDFAISISDGSDRYNLREALSQVTVTDATIKCRSGYNTNPEKEEVLRVISGWKEYQQEMSVKLYDKAEVKTQEPDYNDPDEDYETKYILECSMPEDKLNKLVQMTALMAVEAPVQKI